MPLHLAELRKHTEQNEKIIELLEKLIPKETPVTKPKPTNTRGGKTNVQLSNRK